MTSPLETSLQEILDHVDRQAFTPLFTETLAWNRPEHPAFTIEMDGRSTAVKQVANYRGLGVWHCPCIPSREGQRQVDKEVARRSTERLIIFTEPDRQEWRWPRYPNHRGIGNPRLVNHPHATGQPNPSLVERLTRIAIDPSAGTTLPELLQRMRDAFDAEAEKASVAAARLMGALYEQLSTAGVADSDASIILARILFLMFGDDTGMWRPNTASVAVPNLFHDYLTDHTDPDGLDLAERLQEVFKLVDTPMDQRPAKTDALLNRIPYINGGIFHDPVSIPSALPATLRAALIDACKFDWGQISPAVFGSMFQEVKSAEERRALGEHYTTEKNILKTIDPLFMDELRERLDAAWDSKAQLTRLHNSLGNLRFFDPACGCGNFLVVAYRELRALELEILKRRIELNELDGRRSGAVPEQLSMDASDWLKVTIDQFYGIEIESWPARIAQTAMFLVDHQANQRMEQDLGNAPHRLPISLTAHITIGNALRLDWQSVLPASADVRVFGNPPFLGHASRTREQAADLRAVWNSDGIGRLDYVTGWYAKALEYFAHDSGRWAFVSTSSICQGEPVEALWEPILAERWRVLFAHQSFVWTSEARGSAAVHCVIVGFTRDFKAPSTLFTYPNGGTKPAEAVGAGNINPYLVDAVDVIVEQTRRPVFAALRPAAFGNMPRDDGNLVVEPDELDAVKTDPIAAKYLRRYVGSRELMHDRPRWCLWLVDATPGDLENSPVLAARLQGVREFRSASSAESTRGMAATPQLFGQRAQPDVSYLCLPRVVSERRRFFTAAYFPPDVISSDAVFMAPDPDGIALAMVSSTQFITWMKTIGGRLESRIRFSNTFSYNTFPMPTEAMSHLPALSEAAAGVVAARGNHPGKSLAALYDPDAMPADLLAAHAAVDSVIDPLFGLTETATLAARQASLLASYSRLTGR